MMLCPHCHQPATSADNGRAWYCVPCQALVGDKQAAKPGKVAVRGACAAETVSVLTLPYPPSVNHLFATVNGRRIKSAEGRAFCAAAGILARQAHPEPFAGRLAVAIVIHPKRGIGMDVDNAAKATLDALTGVLWADDRQVWRLTIERAAAVAGGRLEVIVSEYQETQ